MRHLSISDNYDYFKSNVPPYRQGDTANHLALVTTRPFLIDSDYMDPKVHFFLVYFFEATSGVTW